jgi:rare lipoprotein A
VAPFFDVNEGDYNYTAIEYLRINSLIQGYDDGAFRPNNNVNRAEAVKMLQFAFGKKLMSKKQDFNFPDIKEDEWFYPYVLDAWNRKAIDGYDDGNFYPGKNINKVEALKIALLYEGNNIPTEVAEKPYPDAPLTEWFTPYATVAKERTLYLPSRSGGLLSPGETLNRGQFAELIYRMLKTSKDNPTETRFARATWYGFEDVNWGTASGQAFDVHANTAAHKTLPFGTMLKVINLSNGKEVIVRVNDRGPYATGVDLDLTQDAFAEISSIGAGIIFTQYEIIPDEPEKKVDTTPVVLEIQYGF